MKLKRILAIAGIIVLLGLYLSTLVFALMGSPDSKNWLMASLFCTIVLPMVLYAYQLFLKYRKK